MKRFFGAILALAILSIFCIPVSASTCESHMTEGFPLGEEGYFEAVDNDTHNVCYNCDACNEKVIVKTEAHDVSEVDGKCIYCGFKVHTHTFHVEYESVNEDAHIERSTCPCGHVVEEEKAHEFFTIADDLVCSRCGLQASENGTEDVQPPIGEGENQMPPGEENTPPAEDDGFIISQFFEGKVLPLLISAGSALLLLIASLAPMIKLIGKLKKKVEDFRVLCASLKTSNSDKDKIIAKINPDSFENKLNKKISELNTVRTELIDVKASMAQLIAQFELLKKGAMNAWAQSPAAVAALTASPNDMVIAELTSKVSSFENYIREQKGEEAEEIISKLKGESHDEQGNVPSV